MPTRPGTIRLFQISGITVFMHWSWLLAATYETSGRSGTYSTLVWNVLEYLGLFAIITMHEFGHAFACRSVGGRADQILLWPLGGIAIVDPPKRPGALLWSIAAGPLVNVALSPILGSLALLISAPMSADVHALLRSLTFITIGLLLFNLLPVYPLDGGQILLALLWFVIGRARSIAVSAIIGLGGVVGIGWLAFNAQSPWLGLIALFLAWRCIAGLQLARSLNSMARAPHREGLACPSCHALPLIGPFWTCGSCGAAFDVFDPIAAARPLPSEITTLNLSAEMGTSDAPRSDETRCPACLSDSVAIRCLQCDAVTRIADWQATAVACASPTSRIVGVTSLRRPRPPSIAPIVLGVCVAIGALMVFFVAIAAFSMSLRMVNTEASALRHAAVALSGLSLLPVFAAIFLFARYRRSRKAFNLALQPFNDERDEVSVPERL